LSPQQIVERERRWARRVAVATLVGTGLALASVFAQNSVLSGGSDASQLRSVDSHANALLAISIVRALGFVLMSVPLLYLFRAAQARSSAVRAPLVGFAFIGPLLFAVQAILGWAGSTDAASAFVNDPASVGKGAEHLANEAIKNSSLEKVAAGVSFSALLGLVIGMIYIPLQATRTGLLTRFWGTLGMALGASLVLIPFGVLGLLLWFAFLGLLIGGWWPQGRPPAWETGVAMPWPKPGEEDATVVEGKGAEVAAAADGDAMAQGGKADGADEDDDAGSQQRGQAGRRRKRKRRR
jgi:hypothetical protein